MSFHFFAETFGRDSCDAMDKGELERIRGHLFDRSYMSGLKRDEVRIKAFGEVFTPKGLVDRILDKMSPDLFIDPSNTFLDPTCGDGEFLAGVLWRKLTMQKNPSLAQALTTLYGVDIQDDNVELCKERLLCGRSDLADIVEKRIIEHDALEYDFSFDDDTDSTDYRRQGILELSDADE